MFIDFLNQRALFFLFFVSEGCMGSRTGEDLGINKKGLRKEILEVVRDYKTQLPLCDKNSNELLTDSVSEPVLSNKRNSKNKSSTLEESQRSDTPATASTAADSPVDKTSTTQKPGSKSDSDKKEIVKKLDFGPTATTSKSKTVGDSKIITDAKSTQSDNTNLSLEVTVQGCQIENSSSETPCELQQLSTHLKLSDSTPSISLTVTDSSRVAIHNPASFYLICVA